MSSVPASMPDLSGAVLFGRYAFPPNRLGYCGPEDHVALLQYVAERRTERGLIELEKRFAGAYPYLQLIAQANHIADPFDRRVVEAYWIGNACLERVGAPDFHDSLHERFRNRMDARTFGWLETKLELGARPHHNFHVFDVYARAGLMNDRSAPILLETMDSCRISWGRIAEVDGAELVVERPAMELCAGKLALTKPLPFRVTRQIDGRGFADSARNGDCVSIHWNWVCDVLDSSSLRRLVANTKRSLALANTTL